MAAATAPIPPERIRELLAEDGRLVLRYAPFVLAIVMAGESFSHVGLGEPWMIAYPAAACAVLLGLGLLARRPETSPRFVSLALFGGWLLGLASTALHSSEHILGTIAFLLMYLISGCGLVMPTVPVVLGTTITWGFLLYLTLSSAELMGGLAAALPIAFSSLPIAALVYISRRRAILSAESHRLLTLRLQDESARAERLDRMAAMAGGVVHHFNNLLTSMIGGSSLAIQELGPDHPAAAALGDVVSSGERAAMLTHRLAAFTGNSHASKARVAAEDWIAAAFLEAEADGRTLSVEIADDLPEIEANLAQLRELLGSLVRNAADAMPGDEGIRVVATRSPRDAGLVVEVSDEGEGIPPDHELRIFEPFFTTRGPSRAGLGLSLALGIARLHGGQLQVESSPGKGTRVEVWLPAA